MSLKLQKHMERMFQPAAFYKNRREKTIQHPSLHLELLTQTKQRHQLEQQTIFTWIHDPCQQ